MFGGWKTWFRRSRAGGTTHSSAPTEVQRLRLLPTLMIIEHGDSSLVTAAIYSCFLAKRLGYLFRQVPVWSSSKALKQRCFMSNFMLKPILGYFGIYWSQLTNANIFQGVGPPSTIFGSWAWIRPCLTVFGITPSDHTLDVWDSVEGPKQPSVETVDIGWQ